MTTFQPVIITAVVSVAVLAWVILCAFIIGLVCVHMKRDDAELIKFDAAIVAKHRANQTGKKRLSSIPAYTPYLTEKVCPRATTTDTETPSSADCPMHGPNCEAWL